MAAAPRYFTFAPGKAPIGKGAQQITLKEGEHLAFQPGKGYYAKSAPVTRTLQAVTDPGAGGGTYVPPPPAAPNAKAKPVPLPPNLAPPPVDPFAPRSQADIDAAAAAQAQGQLTPQQDEVRRQQENARRAAAADEAAITGFQTAASGLLAGIAPQVGAGYQEAARTVGDVGTHVGGQVGEDLAAKQAADDAFAASQGQSGGHTVDPTAAGSVVGYLGGVNPAESLAQQGAAQQALAAKQVQIPLDAGRQQLDARMALAAQQQDDYAQQLIHIAQQFPGLKAQALQQLNQYELDKAKYREGVAMDAEQKRVNDANIAAQKADTIRQDRAEKANEKAAGLTNDLKIDAAKYRWASLNFQNQKELDKAKAAAAKGKTIDVAASKLLGHIVYKDGSEDPSIKVKQPTVTDPTKKAEVKAQQNRAKAVSSARVTGYNYAVKIMGKPEVNKNQGALGEPGKYIARPDAKGVFPAVGKYGVKTTNNPALAQRTGGLATSYADAQLKVYAEIDGEGLQARYGYSKQQVMAIVNQALARAGWKKG